VSSPAHQDTAIAGLGDLVGSRVNINHDNGTAIDDGRAYPGATDATRGTSRLVNGVVGSLIASAADHLALIVHTDEDSAADGVAHRDQDLLQRLAP
jgi:hypothetical protein